MKVVKNIGNDLFAKRENILHLYPIQNHHYRAHSLDRCFIRLVNLIQLKSGRHHSTERTLNMMGMAKYRYKGYYHSSIPARELFTYPQ